MNMRQIVAELQRKGHSVTFYVRKDGGILIKTIDGERFTTGASGNVRARQIVGTNISKARSQQLQYATRTRQSLRKKPRLKIDNEIENAYNRAKKKWNKAFHSKNGTPHPAGYFGRSRIDYAIEKFGKEEALRRILEAERYASGVAYSKNVQILAMFIADAGNKYNSQELLTLSTDVLQNAYTIREEWIQPAYDELYKLNAGVEPKIVAANTRKILRL